MLAVIVRLGDSESLSTSVAHFVGKQGSCMSGRDGIIQGIEKPNARAINSYRGGDAIGRYMVTG